MQFLCKLVKLALVTNFDEIWNKYSFRTNIWHVFFFFLSAVRVKTTPQIFADPEHILSNISKITENYFIIIISIFLTTNLMVYTKEHQTLESPD